MARRWLTVPAATAGPESERRPDFGGVAVDGYAVAADDGAAMLVMVEATDSALDTIAGQGGVTEIGAESGPTRFSAELTDDLTAQAQSYGAGATWTPAGYDVVVI